MSAIWTHRFEVIMRPLRDLDAPPSKVYIETRTAAQAGRDAVTQHPDMKVLSISRATDVAAAEAPAPLASVVPLARAANHR